MKNLLFLLFVIAGLVACNNAPTEETEVVEEETAMEVDSINFGEPVDPSGAMSFEELLAAMDGKDSLEAKVVVNVESVCQKKGCWMDVAGDSSEEVVKVTFYDYGFFVPLDFDGSKAVVEGVAYRQITSVDELRHMAEDANKTEEEIMAITEPQEELRFVATGVTKL